MEICTQLAPGFRFHPTDEELICYYLKRKITGKKIRVDAIAEIDLYGAEPWDLPPRSRLRTRDMEWYFFTSLDRKYSNRCRTNRVTIEGFWKTTGKDRPIHRGFRIVGLKKTLVYHTGRAPRGQRTNWVMHEYRLEDQDLARAGIPQDGYVVCRIFQKSGPGPQNGAQYGAPFIEEDWEMEEEQDEKFVPVNSDQDDTLLNPAGQDFVQLGDFFESPDSVFQDLEAEHEFASQTEDSSILVDEIFKAFDSLDDVSHVTQDAEFSALQGAKTTLNGLGKREGAEDQSNYASIQSNGSVQSEDIFVEDSTDLRYSDNCLLEISNSNSVVDGTYPSKVLLENSVEGVSHNTILSTNKLDQLQIRPQPAVQHDRFLQPFDLLDDGFWEYPFDDFFEYDSIFYDALDHEVSYLEDGFMFENSLVYLDFLEALMTYYDAADDELMNSSLNLFLSQFNQADSPEWTEPNDSPEVFGSKTSYHKETFHESLAQLSSLGKLQTGDGYASGLNENLTDAKLNDFQDKKSVKFVISMLKPVSAPPTFTNEVVLICKTATQIPAASVRVLRLTADIIPMGDRTTVNHAETWTLEKHTEHGFHQLSYAGPRKKVFCGFFQQFIWVASLCVSSLRSYSL